jgi:hypothetical protein
MLAGPSMAEGTAVNPNRSFALCLYGFSSNLSPVKGMSPEQIAGWLKERHVNGVFITKESDEVLGVLRRAGIRIYREMTLFASKSLYQQNPQWRPITADGTDQEPDGWYYGLCPNKEDLRQKRLEEFEKRIGDARIDGVWLDFIRYPIRWEKQDPTQLDNCFCDDCIRLYREAVDSEFEVPQDLGRAELAAWILEKHLPSWIEFKTERIGAWVHEARLIRDRVRPNATIGIFTVPWSSNEQNGAIFRVVGQDYVKLAEDVDIFSPMVYHLLCRKGPSWPAEFTKETILRTGKPVWPIVQAMDEPSKLPPEELEQVILDSGKASGTGVIIFTAGHLDKENKWEPALRAFRILAGEKESKP